MPVPLLKYLPQVRKQITRAPHLLVILDYDGTLTPIVDRPCDAHLEAATRKTLTVLAHVPNTTVAMMSGRALEDVQPRVGIEGLIYAGNHGLEIKGPNTYFTLTGLGDAQGELQELASALADRLRHIPGTFVEDKRLTLSVHYRQVHPTMMGEVREVVFDAFRGFIGNFRLTTGRKVFEIRPNVDWNKGMASLWIRNHIGQDALPIYLGDDETDEDAFLALRDGITVKVGNDFDTEAVYYVREPADVLRFLEWLI